MTPTATIEKSGGASAPPVALAQSRAKGPAPHLEHPSGPGRMVACLVITDALALSLATAVSVGLKYIVDSSSVYVMSYVNLWPFLLVFLAMYGAVGLYSGVALSPPEELRRSTVSSTLLFVFLAAVTVTIRGSAHLFTWTLLLALVLSVALMPLLRACVRQMFGRAPWWGYPTVVFGAGDTGRRLVRALLQDPGLGLKPTAVFDDDPFKHGAIDSVPVLGSIRDYREFSENRPTSYAVVAMPSVRPDRLIRLVEQHIGPHCKHILLIPDLFGFANLWVTPKSVGGMLGLEVLQQVAVAESRFSKRLLDLSLSVAAMILLAPLFLIISLAIKLDSRGPVLFGHKRIGRGGKEFRAWKFRSMAQNSAELLETYLASDPELRCEWERDHKLKNDPRITRVGSFLRKTSLDELPQLWNVVMNEMSLVGPRPIVQSEVIRYGTSFDLYTKVKGGVTGLWQVSGRSDTSYDQRVSLDTFYVRNWSIWLDLCILYRTIGTLLFRSGAY